MCVAVEHRQCISVKHIHDVAKGICNDPEFLQLPQKEAHLRTKLNDMKDARNKDGASLRKTRAAIVNEIKAIHEKIKDILDKMEITAVQELDCLIAKHELSIENEMEAYTQMQTDLKGLTDSVGIKKSLSEPVRYIGFKKCEDKIKEDNAILWNAFSIENYNVTFQKNQIEDHLISMKRFGELKAISVFTKHLVATDFHPKHVFHIQGYKEFNVKMNKDPRHCQVLGICELPSGDIVITDSNNLKVELLDQKYRVVNHCEITQTPWDVCHIGGYEVVFCINGDAESHELLFINVTNGNLVPKKNVCLPHVCFAIAHRGGKLYV